LTPQFQHTLAGPAIIAGIGVHIGQRVRLSIRPAPADSGFSFVRTDIKDRNNIVPATALAVCQTRLGTVIGNAAGVTVSTIEHLMSAFCALGVDNAVIELDGPEVPIMDGSALPFVQVLDRVGLRRQDAARRYIEILEPVSVEETGKTASLEPCDRFEVAFEIVFDSPAIGRQLVDLPVTAESFREELADCRTFGFMHEVEALRAAGLARGGSLENVVVIENDAVVNPEGLRRPDEFVRHKALDAVGDLYLFGAPLLGRFETHCGGHGLNNALVRAVLARESAWRYVSAAPAWAAE
jgi:UDP-3-O-[3-hydroxymyristoyl] N-acetylglucosamine deacetylase